VHVVSRIHRKLVVCVVGATAWASACAGARPVASWSFEHGVAGWRSPDSAIGTSREQARGGAASLRVGVAFPEAATVWRPASVAVDAVGQVSYDVYVPADAPETIRTLLFFKDKDGLWFQHLRPEPLRPGAWTHVSVAVDPRSPLLEGSGHHGVWNAADARRMCELGVKFFCHDAFKGSLYIDNVVAAPAAASDVPLRVLNLWENTLRVGRYEKFEVTFDLSRPVADPFDPEEIRIDATFVDPHGKVVILPAFYYQGFTRRLSRDREELTPAGRGVWKVRFAPVTLGRHTYYLSVRHRPARPARGEPAELVTGTRAFECVASPSPGFIRVSKKDPLYFEFTNGQWFYPIGHNVHSPSDDTPRSMKVQRGLGAEALPDRGTYNYDDIFAKMAAHGENFAEVWMCAWWLGLEWAPEWKHYHGLEGYNLHSAWKLDYLVDLAVRHGIYLHLVFDNHGKASTWVDDEWVDNPYSVANGGFLEMPEEFFSSERAKALYRRKLRYIVARWAYAAQIMGFELWSEVDLVGSSYGFDSDGGAAAPKLQWLREMSAHLHRIDPWEHPITTHVSANWQRIKAAMAAMPNIDHLVCNVYRMGRGSIVRAVQQTAEGLNGHGKPGFVTEFGGHWLGSSAPEIKADLHVGLWATYMTHTAGTPLLWWFQFIDAGDLYWNYKALAAYHAGEDRRGLGLVTRRVSFPSGGYRYGGLALQNDRMAYVWVYTRIATYRMPERGSAEVARDVVVSLEGLRDGAYRVEVWDTYEGKVVATLELTATFGRLAVPLPGFRTDCALKVKPAP